MTIRFARGLSTLLALVALTALGGCGPRTVASEVTRFHAPAVAAGQAGVGDGRQDFVILPTEAQAGSLEFGRYADSVAAELRAQGFDRVAAIEDAEFVVRLAYGVTDGRERVTTRPGFSTSFGASFGNFWSPGYSALGVAVPLTTDIETRTIYSRYLQVEILDAGAYRNGRIERVFEGRAINEGPSRALPAVMPYLVEALFADFPGTSGTTQIVRVPIERQ